MAAAVTIREAGTQDVEALCVLVAQLGYPVAADELRERLDGLIAIGEVPLVAVSDRVVGVLTWHITPVLHRPTAVGRITSLVVVEGRRGQGVGRSLVEAAEQLLGARRCALVEVTSNVKREAAHSFYRALGYEQTSVRLSKALASH